MNNYVSTNTKTKTHEKNFFMYVDFSQKWLVRNFSNFCYMMFRCCIYKSILQFTESLDHRVYTKTTLQATLQLQCRILNYIVDYNVGNNVGCSYNVAYNVECRTTLQLHCSQTTMQFWRRMQATLQDGALHCRNILFIFIKND